MNQKTVVELKKICRNMNITTKEKNKKQLIQSIQYKKRKNNMQSNEIYRKMKVNELKKICTSNKITTSNKNKTQLIQSIQKYENKKIMMGGAIERNLTGNDTTFNINSNGVILCRHGHSCANLLKDVSTTGELQSKNEPDTPLNRYGFYQAKMLNKCITTGSGRDLSTLHIILNQSVNNHTNISNKLSNIKIYCSPLRRCIQTAMVVLRNIPNLTVHICPYVMEKKRRFSGNNNDNLPFWILDEHDRTWKTYNQNYLGEQNKIKFIKEYINNFIETSDTAIGDLHIEDSTVYPTFSTFSTQEDTYTDSDFSEGPQADKFRDLLSPHSNELVLVFTHSGFITEEFLKQSKKSFTRKKTKHYAVNTQMNFIPNSRPVTRYRVLYPSVQQQQEQYCTKCGSHINRANAEFCKTCGRPLKFIIYKNKKEDSHKTVDLEMNIDDLKVPSTQNIDDLKVPSTQNIDDLKNTHTTNSPPPKYISFDFDKKDKIQELISEGYDIIGCGCSKKTQSVYKQNDGSHAESHARHLFSALHQPRG